MVVGDRFVDWNDWSKVIRHYATQQGFSLWRIKNVRIRHIIKCENLDSTWKIHASPLHDGVTWQIKFLRGKHSSAKIDRNSMTSYSWIAKTLYKEYKVTLEMEVADLQNFFMEMSGLDSPDYIIRRAKRLMRD